jgi:hypothetical protein
LAVLPGLSSTFELESWSRGKAIFFGQGACRAFFYLLDEIVFAFEQHFYGFAVNA